MDVEILGRKLPLLIELIVNMFFVANANDKMMYRRQGSLLRHKKQCLSHEF